MFRMPIFRLALGASLLATGTGCINMDFENLNAPDRIRALSQAGDLEALVAGTFRVMWSGVTGASVSFLFPSVATEMTAATTYYGPIYELLEPRSAYNNAPDIPLLYAPWGARDLWSNMLEVVSSANDGIATIAERQMAIVDASGDDQTARTLAFAKYMQGWAWGNLALIYDTPLIITEDQPITSDPIGQGRDALVPWPQALDLALASLEEARTIAAQNSFTFPARDPLWFGTPDELTSQDLVRMANTLSARLLVLAPRSPEERARVDWQRVLELTASGITRDLEIQLGTSEPNRSSSLYVYGNSTSGITSLRWDQRLIGQADVSGAYQKWISSPLEERDRFLIVTPDRRITGPDPSCVSPALSSCTAHGAYTRYLPPTAWPTERGTYMHSNYQWARQWNRGAGFASNAGTHPMMTVDENNLLRAEALLRTGDLEGAADLINITRTRSHTLRNGGQSYPGLPPVTAAGVPQSDSCVPRTDAGECGDLMVALRYERMIELALLDAIRGFADSRGFGLLPDGAWTQAPVPGGELQLYGIRNYSHGGVGSEHGAVYRPVTMADL